MKMKRRRRKRRMIRKRRGPSTLDGGSDEGLRNAQAFLFLFHKN
jgi:hypothetical protein